MTSRIAYNNPRSNGSFGLPYHYELLADSSRLRPLSRAIARSAKGKRVFESGTGSGVLSILAARAGAERVYATEPDPKVAAFARQNVERSGYSDVIRIIEKDTLAVDLSDIDDCPVDMVMAEHLSTWQVTEVQTVVMNHINKTLASAAAIRIPESLTNCAELAHSKYTFEDVVELRTLYFGFSGIRKPTILSDRVEVERVDFYSLNPTSIVHCFKVQATRSGIVNSLRLTSPLVVFRKIRFTASDSLLPPVIIPLNDDLPVSAGDCVEVRIEYERATDWDRFLCAARVMPPQGAGTIPTSLRETRRQPEGGQTDEIQVDVNSQC